MNPIEKIKVPLREKSGIKLIGFTVIAFLIIAVIVFLTVFVLSYYSGQKMLDQFIMEVPKIVEKRKQEFETRMRVYESDSLKRSELGAKLYAEEDALADAERLELTRGTVSAAGVYLIDGRRQLLAAAGPAELEESLREYFESIEAGKPALTFYPSLSQNVEPTEKQEGSFLVMQPLASTQQSLVFAFPCPALVELYHSLGDWPDILKRTLSGTDGGAAVRTGDGTIAYYPQDGLSPEETAQLIDELDRVFDDSGSFRNRGGVPLGKEIKLLGSRCLAVMLHYQELDADVMLMDSFDTLEHSGKYTARTLAAIIALGMILFQIYVFRRLSKETPDKSRGAAFRKRVIRTLMPGMISVLIVTGLFSVMLMMLENRSINAMVATAKRETVQYEIDWHEQQGELIRQTYSDIYRTRAQTLADFVTLHPEYLTHGGLAELNELAGTEYLMLFDRSGRELAASNSYTGFAVGGNLSEEYRPVLLGYPSALAGPAADPYTGQPQLGAAILLKDAEGQPDGFLLSVFDAQTLQRELDGESIESAVNGFVVQNGHAAAVVDDAEGRFLAHTEAKMIGQRVADHLPSYEPGTEIEGFSTYNGKNVYISGSSNAGKSLLYIVPSNPDREVRVITGRLIVGVLALLLVYLLGAGVLCARLVEDIRAKLASQPGRNNSLMVFANGYVIFLSLLAVYTAILSAGAMWPAFTFIFDGKWARGVHLFSVWAATLIVAGTLCVVSFARAMLKIVESRLNKRSRTITRLIDSVICYSTCIFLLFRILSMFGVNTKTLLASAGVLSIAVGMGAQSMASDLLAGFFMMLEGSIHVGDHVSVSGVTGDVTDMGIRTTEITDADGNVVILNNSHVGSVLNMSRKHEQQEQEDEAEDKA